MTNLERMIALAEEFFEAHHDPDQLVVNEAVMTKLRIIHPAALSERTDQGGPVAWMLLIPTNQVVMGQFLRREISEQELLDETKPDGVYEAIYLCSALVLPEYRGRGIAKELAKEAIQSIQKDHPIKALFFWPFSDEGMRLASVLSEECRLPLYRREDK